MYEVHYCSPAEFDIYEVSENDKLIEKGNMRFKNFTDAKKLLLELLRKDKQFIDEKIKQAISLKASNVKNL